MSAEDIAKVVSDLREGRVRALGPTSDPERQEADVKIHALARALIMKPVVVDATAIYNSLVAKDEPIQIYEDHPCIAPPWEEAAICYRNEHGNVIVMHASVMPFDPKKPPWDDMADTHTVEWDRVKWRLDTFVWLGGRSQGRACPTAGPAHMWQFAIYPDGAPADLHWVQLVPEYPMTHWDMANLVLLGALNFMNCFAGDTDVVTRDGPMPIGSLTGKEVEVLSRDPHEHAAASWTKARVESFGQQQILELTVRRGRSPAKVIATTAGHRWFVHRRVGKSNRIVEVTTDSLKAGDRLVTVRPRSRADRCLISGIGVAHGVVYGDGSRNDHGAYVDLIGEKRSDLLQFFPQPQTTTTVSGTRVSSLPRSFKDLPREDEGSSYLYSFLAGWFAADGTVGRQGQVRLSCATEEPLLWLRRVALSSLGMLVAAPTSRLRTGINGEESMIYEVLFDRATLQPSFFVRPHDRSRYESLSLGRAPDRWKVESVVVTDRFEEVFCATVPETEAFVLDGMILTGNCRNVELVEPKRPRPVIRRLARLGVTVKTINVFPVGRSSRSEKEPGAGVPLTSVRGHFARYGPEYGRGLLFGKLAGRFWIAQHARGDSELGKTEADYKIRIDS